MPASKKRIQRGAGAGVMPSQPVPAALRDWVHIWHGVQVRPRGPLTAPPAAASSAASSSVFHSGSRMEALSFWQQLVRLPSNSLFSTSLHTVANPRRQYKDFLYVLLNMRWPMLILVLLAVFLFNIVAFALLVFLACGDPDSLQKSVNLSYQTFSTIGFGVVYPTTTCSNVVMVVESFASMLVTSAITGLVFAKFAKPKAKVAFSKVCVLQPYGKQYLALVVRVANATQSKDVTHDVIMESTFKLNLLRIERNADDSDLSGHDVASRRRPDTPPAAPHGTYRSPTCRPDVLCSYNLKLVQNNFITFRMGIAVVHVIDEDSPLFGMNEADIAGADMILECSMSGVDSTLQDTVTERYTYTADDFKWGFRFAELLDFNERNSEVIMDFAKLSAIERAPIDDARYIRSTPVGVASTSRRQVSFRGNAKLRRPELFARSTGMRSLTLADVDTTGSTTSQESLSSRDSDPAGQLLRSIDELSPDDLPETTLRLERSMFAVDGVPRLNGMASPRGPRRFSLGMEPLFEPLLQTAVGCQRVQTSHPQTPADPPMPNLLRGGRLLSGSAGVNSPGLAVDEVTAPAESLLPERQRKRLQNELTGDVQVNVHDDEELSTDGDEYEDEEPADDENGDDIERRRRLFRSRSHNANQSAVSIDVQDTPRFLNISPLNIPKSYDFMILYNSALYQRWPRIILVFVIAFVIINAVFALLYWFHAGSMEVYSDISLAKYELAFFMSVHTLATIGYGSIAPSPTSAYMNFWVLVEASLGIIVTTIITGIAWSKFARPRAHIHFSSKIVITNIYGHRCLVFRAANTRHSGDVHENFFRIGVILTNRKTGLRQLYDVPLVTAEWPTIKLPATLIHIIDESSPFFKFQSIDNLSESRVSVIVLLTGLDTTFSENVYARKMYFWDDFAYNMRFADFAVLQRDRVEVDFNKFDALEDDDTYMAPTPLWEEEEEANEDKFAELSDEEKLHHEILAAAV